MNQRLIRFALVLGALSLLLWAPAALLFAGPAPATNALAARGIALAVLAGIYLAAILLVLLASKRLLPQLAVRWRLAVSVLVGTLSTLSLPFVALPVLFAIRALCTTLAACEGETAQQVPHAFYVAAGYPAQVLLVLPLIVALLYLGSSAPESGAVKRSNGA